MASKNPNIVCELCGNGFTSLFNERHVTKIIGILFGKSSKPVKSKSVCPTCIYHANLFISLIDHLKGHRKAQRKSDECSICKSSDQVNGTGLTKAFNCRSLLKTVPILKQYAWFRQVQDYVYLCLNCFYALESVVKYYKMLCPTTSTAEDSISSSPTEEIESSDLVLPNGIDEKCFRPCYVLIKSLNLEQTKKEAVLKSPNSIMKGPSRSATPSPGKRVSFKRPLSVISYMEDDAEEVPTTKSDDEATGTSTQDSKTKRHSDNSLSSSTKRRRTICTGELQAEKSALGRDPPPVETKEAPNDDSESSDDSDKPIAELNKKVNQIESEMKRSSTNQPVGREVGDLNHFKGDPFLDDQSLISDNELQMEIEKIQQSLQEKEDLLPDILDVVERIKTSPLPRIPITNGIANNSVFVREIAPELESA